MATLDPTGREGTLIGPTLVHSPSISVIVPAYNEEGNLKSTVESICSAARDFFTDFEILIIDDGSSDKTYEIALDLSNQSNILVHRHPRNLGLGRSFQTGVQLSKKLFVSMVPGDNAFGADTLRNLFRAVGTADIVCAYTENLHVRPWARRALSVNFVRLVNFLYGYRLRYYNGPAVFLSADAKNTPIDAHGFAYMAELIVRLLDQGRSAVEVGLFLQERLAGGSQALRIRNIINVVRTLVFLFYDLRIKSFSQRPKTKSPLDFRLTRTHV